MRINAKWIGAGIAVVAAAAAGSWLLRERSTEKPNFRPIMAEGDFALRAYPSLLVAETMQRGSRPAALDRGFAILSDYIFAESREGEAIAMTAPVLSDLAIDGGWRTRFVMPGRWTRKTLPEPTDEVTIDEIPARRVATIRFRGKPDARTLAERESELRRWIAAKGLRATGPAEHASYDRSYTPAAIHRNELWISVG